MDKRKLSETEICVRVASPKENRCITPALEQAGWQKAQIRREYTLTQGRIIVRGKLVARGKRKRADYVLFYHPNHPIALIEAKDNKHSIGAGMQQALGYAELLDVPFVFSSNGDGFLLHDRSGTYSQTLARQRSQTGDYRGITTAGRVSRSLARHGGRGL